jgi:VanZ family protein
MDTSTLRQVLRFLWVAAILIVVVGSLLPAGSGPMRLLEHFHINDKIQHFAAYAALAFLPALHERRHFLAWAALGLVALGILLEFGQLLSVGRFFEVGDMAADAVGVCLGMAFGLPLRSAVG